MNYKNEACIPTEGTIELSHICSKNSAASIASIFNLSDSPYLLQFRVADFTRNYLIQIRCLHGFVESQTLYKLVEMWLSWKRPLDDWIDWLDQRGGSHICVEHRNRISFILYKKILILVFPFCEINYEKIFYGGMKISYFHY